MKKLLTVLILCSALTASLDAYEKEVFVTSSGGETEVLKGTVLVKFKEYVPSDEGIAARPV